MILAADRGLPASLAVTLERETYLMPEKVSSPGMKLLCACHGNLVFVVCRA
jgi:hypothetical protein